MYLACALKLAELCGRPISPNSLLAGIPLENGHLTPKSFTQTLERIEFDAAILQKDFSTINEDNIPCFLLLNDNKIALLKEIKGDNATVFIPHQNDVFISVSLKELEEMYAGDCVLIRETPAIEDVDTGKKLTHEMHWLWGTLWEFRKIYYQVAIASVITNFLSILIPLYSLNVYDRVIPNDSTPTLWVLSIGICLALVFEFILRIIKSNFVDLVSKNADIILSSKLISRILSLPVSMQSLSVGSLIQHVKELETIRDFFSSATLVTFIDFPFGILVLAFIGMIGGFWLFFIGLISMIIVLIFGIIIQKIIARSMEETFTIKNKKSSYLAELVTGLENIKGIIAEGRMQKNWEFLSAEHAKTARSSSFLSSFATSFFQLVQNLNYVLFVIVGTFLIIAGELTVGGLIACTILSSRAILPMVQGAGMITKFSQVKIAYNTIARIMKLPTERISDNSYISHEKLTGSIEFKNVSFRYNADAPDVLKNVSFKINPGDKVVILGRIGSGKSTIEKLLMGFYYPQEGNILIDNIDIRQFDPSDIRSNIGYLPQDIYLFSGSIAHNILLSDRPLEQKQVDDAIRLSGITDFVNNHPKGFNTPVGEGGKWLSGGQKQAIGIARSFLHQSPILILDEPTAMMDSKTEQNLLDHINELSHDRTLIVVSHNLNFLSIANKVLLLDNGRVQYFGDCATFKEVLKKQKHESPKEGDKS